MRLLLALVIESFTVSSFVLTRRQYQPRLCRLASFGDDDLLFDEDEADEMMPIASNYLQIILKLYLRN